MNLDPRLMNLDPRQKLPSLQCNGCKLCCIGDTIALKPGEDNPALYKTKLGADGVRVLAHGKDGNCYALGKQGCQIHHIAPAMCRAFDCRRYVLNIIQQDEQVQGTRWKDKTSGPVMRQGVKKLAEAGIRIAGLESVAG
jgi:hypothetical protein